MGAEYSCIKGYTKVFLFITFQSIFTSQKINYCFWVHIFQRLYHILHPEFINPIFGVLLFQRDEKDKGTIYGYEKLRY